jgi:hypothetical protein
VDGWFRKLWFVSAPLLSMGCKVVRDAETSFCISKPSSSRGLFFSLGRTAVSTVPSFSLSDSRCSLRFGFSFLFPDNCFVYYTWLMFLHLKRAMYARKFLLLRSSGFQSKERAKSGAPRSGDSECFGADGQKSTLTARWDSFRRLGGN